MGTAPKTRAAPRTAPKYDVIVWGASGFVGELICEYLVKQYGADGDVRWAMGGRNEQKLKDVRKSLGRKAASIPIITGDAMNREELDEIVPQTKVILTTVGPYALYGTEMLGACAAHGVDYVDLTGETQWVRRMIDTYQDIAEESGARIVPSCGFDSVPSDLGVFFLNQQAMKQTNAPCTTVKMRVKAMKGGASGGTIASLLNVMAEAAEDRDIRKLLRDPYSLNPKGMRRGVQQPDDALIEYDEDYHSWVAPFVMAAINTRVVRRSNALMDNAYGKKFRYSEAMLMGDGLAGRAAAYAMAGVMGGIMGAAGIGPVRALLSRFVLPKPGEGPSKEDRENGFYNLVFLGKTADEQIFVARVTGDKDPGYGSTSKMIAESAICLAKDVPHSKLGGGIWTPASAMGAELIERLEKNAGLTFAMETPAGHY